MNTLDEMVEITRRLRFMIKRWPGSMNETRLVIEVDTRDQMEMLVMALRQDMDNMFQHTGSPEALRNGWMPGDRPVWRMQLNGITVDLAVRQPKGLPQ